MTSYVTYLRDLVGQKPIILTGTAVILRDQVGRVLLQKRVDNGQWGFPGGMLEMGESLEQAATREVREEVGIEITSPRLIGVVSGADCLYHYPNGDPVWCVTATYEADLAGQTPRALDESTDVMFADLACFDQPLSPPSAMVVTQLGLDQPQGLRA